MSKGAQMSSDAKAGIGALVIFIIFIILAIIAGISMRNPSKLSFAQEKDKCTEIVNGTAIQSGIEGYCDTYIGSDGNLHYYYVQVTDAAKRETKDVYIIWETGKGGKY